MTVLGNALGTFRCWRSAVLVLENVKSDLNLSLVETRQCFSRKGKQSKEFMVL